MWQGKRGVVAKKSNYGVEGAKRLGKRGLGDE